MAALLSALTNWLLFAALVAALGSVAARWVFVPRAAISLPSAEGRLTTEAGRLGFVAARLLPVAMLMVFGRQLYEFRDPFAPWAEDAQLLLTGTDWGRTWTVAMGLSIVALVGYALSRRGASTGWWLASLAIVGLAAYPAFSGHASGTEGLRPLTLAADTLHVLAAGAWVGGLGFVLLAERSWRADLSGHQQDSLLPILVPVFSRVAIVAVATLVLSGSVSSWVHLDGFGALLGTTYGRILALKLAAVASVLLLGAVNWRRLTPNLGSAAGQDALRRNATTELLVAQIVLVVTAILVRTPPMGH